MKQKFYTNIYYRSRFLEENVLEELQNFFKMKLIKTKIVFEYEN